jgi:hypothetical protein
VVGVGVKGGDVIERLFDSDIIPLAGLLVLACAAYLMLRKRSA